MGVLKRLIPAINTVLHRMSGMNGLKVCFAHANTVWKVVSKSTLGTKLAITLFTVSVLPHLPKLGCATFIKYLQGA